MANDRAWKGLRIDVSVAAGATLGKGCVARRMAAYLAEGPARPLSRSRTIGSGAWAEAQDVVQTASAAEGRLRVSLPIDLGRLLMEPLTRIFLRRHPRIHHELDMTDRHVDLIREGYDLVLRAGRVDDTELVARALGAAPLVLVAAPDHLDRHGLPQTLEALRVARHVRYRLGGGPFPITFADGSTLLPDGVMDCDSGFGLRAAALNGVGIAQLLRWTVDDDLRAGRLEIVMPQPPSPRRRCSCSTPSAASNR